MENQMESKNGAVRISEEVVSIIAGIAATDVDGVAGMSGGIAGGIAELLGRKNLAKGVKVEVTEKDAIINLFIIVNYGVRIPEVAFNVQESVKNAVEQMTGLNLAEANVHVEGVYLEKEEKEEDTDF